MFIYKGKTKIFDHSYSRELSNAINQSYKSGIKVSNHKNCSFYLDKFITTSGIGDILYSINGILSVIEAIFYIISTYTMPETSYNKQRINHFIDVVETFFLVFFLLHYLLSICCSQNRLLFIFNLINLIDIVSSVCLFISKLGFAEAANSGYFLRMFRMFRVIYLTKLEYIIQRKTNEQIRHYFVSGVAVMSIILISAAFILEFENLNFRENTDKRELRKIATYSEYLSYHEVVYFIFVTLTTIGFGDIAPQSFIGRLCIVICIAIIILIFINHKSKTLHFSLNSEYALAKYKKISKKPNHLVLIGDCGPESFDACLKELYNEDHGNINFDTIILQSTPNENMKKVYARKKYENNIYYLVGNVLKKDDLKRAQTDNSICVIILANKLANNHREEDFNNIMKAFSINKYSNNIKGKQTSRLYIQLILPETKKIYYNFLVQKNEYDQVPQIICLEEIKLQMLGKSCQCQGINTIISSLITSQKPSIENINDIPSFSNWMKEYLEGLENEIYRIKIKCEYLHNLTFIDLVKIIYELTDYIVIGTDIFYKDLKPFMCLNPYNYLFSPFDHSIYLLASQQPNESEINGLIGKYLEKNKKGTIENNIRLAKVRRLKSGFWANLNKEYEPIKQGIDDEDSNILKDDNEDDSSMSFNLSNIILKDEYNDINNIFNNGFINQNKDSNIVNMTGIKSNWRPRTLYESEFFSFDLLEKHIIIFGVNPNIKNLIIPLRSKDMKKHSPILIIDKNQHISSEIWKEIQYFPDIYYMQGNPINSDDLQKAAISKAHAVVILSKCNQGNGIVDMNDMYSILIYKAVKNESKDTLIIADLLSFDSIGYLSSMGDENLDSFDFWLNEAFASGELYISSMLDTLICQVFYNQYILNIISQLILGVSAFHFSEETMKDLGKYKFLNSSLNLYKTKEVFERYKFHFVRQTISFKLLFQLLLEKNMIVIGILRVYPEDENHKFVFIAPKKETIINIEKDELYVISSDDERDTEDKNKILSDFYSVDLIKTSNSKLNDLADSIKNDVENINFTLNYQLSIKNLTNLTRNYLRNELVRIYKQKEEQIYQSIKNELYIIKKNKNKVQM